MENAQQSTNPTIDDSIENTALAQALNELGRSVNLVTTYGRNHPAARTAIDATLRAMDQLFADRKKILIGAYNGVMTVDDKTVWTVGTLQKSLERRLVRLRITGLRIARGIALDELLQLTECLASSDADAFQKKMDGSGLRHIESENTRYEAVREGQLVADESALAGMDSGVLVLDDEHADDVETGHDKSFQVNQIIAFLKGDVDADHEGVGNELAESTSDPDKLGRMIMESVAIRQSASELSGESLGDIVLGCLRRTYDGLRRQPAFQSTEGKTELRNALLLLEESVLQKMRGLVGDDDPELDRQIVQAIREMDEQLGFELAATQYLEHRDALARDKEELQRFIRTKGADTASELLRDTGFPGSDWRKIVVESGKTGSGPASIGDGISTLATLFEKLETLMKSDTADGNQLIHLLGQANDNLDGRLDTTREKLAALSSTIGGQAHTMSREELLTALAEVAQELMQPLTAINASIEMMLHGYVGEVTDEQQDLLTLASNSGEHLKFLMDMLIDIVGCPTNKGIDNRFHTTSEQVQLLKDAEVQGHLPLNLG